MNERFLVKRKEGYYCAIGDFYIDPVRPVKIGIITHAHADHSTDGCATTYSSAETTFLLKTKYKGSFAKNSYILDYGKQVPINGIKISLFPAGHMLGSAQVLLEYEGHRYLYTSDIKLQDDTTCKPYEFVKADTILVESTFAQKDFRHPLVEDELKKLNTFLDYPIVLGTYAMGKAQRITRLLTETFSVDVNVHARLHRYHNAYRELGVEIGQWKAMNRQDLKARKAGIYLIPMRMLSNYERLVGVKCFAVTGWNNKQHGPSDALNISDHVDWFDLLKIIEKTEAKTIYTTHGDGNALFSYFSDKVKIMPLPVE